MSFDPQVVLGVATIGLGCVVGWVGWRLARWLHQAEREPVTVAFTEFDRSESLWRSLFASGEGLWLPEWSEGTVYYVATMPGSVDKRTAEAWDARTGPALTRIRVPKRVSRNVGPGTQFDAVRKGDQVHHRYYPIRSVIWAVGIAAFLIVTGLLLL